MTTTQYARRFRLIGMASFFSGAIIAVALVYVKWVSAHEWAVGIGLFLAIIPLHLIPVGCLKRYLLFRS
jgi:hypothetical protein